MDNWTERGTGKGRHLRRIDRIDGRMILSFVAHIEPAAWERLIAATFRYSSEPWHAVIANDLIGRFATAEEAVAAADVELLRLAGAATGRREE